MLTPAGGGAGPPTSAVDNGARMGKIGFVSRPDVETRSRRLRVLGAPQPEAAEPAAPQGPRHPSWIRMKMPAGSVFFDLRERVKELGLHTVCQSASCPNIGECWNRRSLTIMILGGICTRSCQFCDVPTGRPLPPDPEEPEHVATMLSELGLHTVCESASCPNIGECWNRKSLTIMILGGICTRSCQFCDVPTGRPLPPDPEEPERVATMLAELGLRHTVITCVDRDDLKDFGAAHWAATIRAVKRRSPELVLEILAGDFKGDTGNVDVVLAAEPDVFAHNLETVPRLSRQVRVQASYARSYAILKHAKARGAITKTGLMLGLGEELEEVRQVLRETRDIGVDIITLGQYLRPSKQHLPLARYLHPDEFAGLKEEALAMGFPHVEAGPMVRSSYHADGQRDIVRELRAREAASGG